MRAALCILGAAGAILLTTLAQAAPPGPEVDDVIDTIPGVHSNPLLRLMNFGRKPRKAEPPKDEVKKSAEQAPAKATRAQAEAILLRRLEVCQRFCEIALQTADEELGRKAYLLEQKAWQSYLNSTSHLTVYRPAQPHNAELGRDAVAVEGGP